jgi:hydrogenase maturation protease
VSDAPTPLLILGLGNVLLADDGAGVAAVNWILGHYTAPEGVLVLDGGTLGLSLLPHLQSAERAILVDAVSADAPPGCLVRLDGEAVGPASRQRLSPHQIGVADLLDTARLLGRLPPELVLWGVVPERIELDPELSPAVRASVPELALAVIEEAHKLGFVFGAGAAAE